MSHRATIFPSDAEILEHSAFAGEQHVLRVLAPDAAGAATPGSFAHITCDAAIPLRRPLSIMRADAQAGWLEFLYKPVGAGLAQLARKQRGERLSVLAPIGNGFALDPARPKVLALGGGVGIPPMIFLAERLKAQQSFEPIVLMGSELPFPFELVPAGGPAELWPEQASMSLALLEHWQVTSRLASKAGLPGAYPGYVPDLARHWLERSDDAALAQTQIAACGPEPMLESTAALAAKYGLPCQLAVEEYMACGVGGCAGCTVLVRTEEGPRMKRVCVDGPVFDAAALYPRVTLNRS